jgi:hypothetical protein
MEMAPIIVLKFNLLHLLGNTKNMGLLLVSHPREAFALNLDTHAIELCAKSPCLWALV